MVGVMIGVGTRGMIELRADLANSEVSADKLISGW